MHLNAKIEYRRFSGTDLTPPFQPFATLTLHYSTNLSHSYEKSRPHAAACRSVQEAALETQGLEETMEVQNTPEGEVRANITPRWSGRGGRGMARVVWWLWLWLVLGIFNRALEVD